MSEKSLTLRFTLTTAFTVLIVVEAGEVARSTSTSRPKTSHNGT